MIETAGGMIPFICHVFLILFGGFFGLSFAFNKNFVKKPWGKLLVYVKFVGGTDRENFPKKFIQLGLVPLHGGRRIPCLQSFYNSKFYEF